MTCWIAQRGTKVGLIEAPTVREAGTIASRFLKLGRCRPRRIRIRDWDADTDSLVWKSVTPDATSWFSVPPRSGWPHDWRGSSLRPATRAEVDAYQAAADQVRDLRGLSRKKMREAFA